MQKTLDIKIAEKYKSTSQKIRVLTESWVDKEVFCPACGHSISSYENNRPVADFYCSYCEEEYELKSKKDSIGNRILDGAYGTMIKRLKSSNNPNFFLLNYSISNFEVLNFFVIPKYFFIPDIIEKRKPLSQNARRAGWVGCNIVLKSIPKAGRIFYIKDRQIESKRHIIQSWAKISFLKEEKIAEKGWILDVMRCVDRLNKKEFLLSEVYDFEEELKIKYPKNKHIKDKIRQQLQFLRDKGYLEFKGRGKYRLTC